MKPPYPNKVLITGGHEVGGVASFAEALRSGFSELGIPAEVIPPSRVFTHWRDLFDPRVLKILSTTSLFAAPFARRAICMAHGFPCVAHVGYLRAFAVLASFRIAAASPGAQVVAVSDYSALHLRSIFGTRVDAVIRNPVHPLFLEPPPESGTQREAITYVGRLVPAKNLHRLLPAILDVLKDFPSLRAWIIGEGPLRWHLEEAAREYRQVEFLGALPPVQVRERLRRSRIFVSGSPTEPFGIVYLEALSQGCAVVMPSSGGGLEIAPERNGKTIQFFGTELARGEIGSALRNALKVEAAPMALEAYSPRAVAAQYLHADTGFSSNGWRAHAGN
jgi:glycosyltransferase involved in cell wall biosynthesis